MSPGTRHALLVAVALLGVPASVPAETYTVRRIGDGGPIVTRAMFAEVGAEAAGANINGPSVIRVPDWLGPETRADPRARYYLYFASHDGDFIRMAWAGEIAGPWTLYNVGSREAPEGGTPGDGVLSLRLGDDDDAIRLGPGGAVFQRHVASPDVHVDPDARRFVMYFHAHDARGKQKTGVATSSDGLNFNLESEGGQPGHGVRDATLGKSYFRVFEHEGGLFAISVGGHLLRAPSADAPWRATDASARNVWVRGPNPIKALLERRGRAVGIDKLRARHFSVRRLGPKTLELFFSATGDTPEVIYRTTLDLTGPWSAWTAGPELEVVLRPELAWEGGNLPSVAGRRGRAPDATIHQLRDPCAFTDADGRLYLFYVGGGEDAIGVVRLEPGS